MAWLVELVLLLTALVGHFSITVWIFNRLHALAMPRRALKSLERLLLGMSAALVVVVVGRWLATGRGLLPESQPQSFVEWIWLIYGIVNWAAAVAVPPVWLVPKLHQRTCPALACNDTTRVDVSDRLGARPIAGAQAEFFAGIPGNELLKIAVQRKVVRLARLPRELSGLTIAHLSDLHMTGQLTQAFYDVVVEETNALKPDLVLITGDILEKEKCLPWVEPTLGRLEARYGKYFILGNHEYRLADPNRLRQALAGVGFTNLGSRWEYLVIGGSRLLLAGNERPWFGSLPDVPNRSDDVFRILLSHTPDQLPWARAQHFDLMLAGHNHGGQIRLPYLGALIAPSLYGCRYAGGLYQEPPTLLHVSRGIAGIHPIRLNCPPEIALLVLEPTAA
jgi:predicted MPP superfamily phosphohydrolase